MTYLICGKKTWGKTTILFSAVVSAFFFGAWEIPMAHALSQGPLDPTTCADTTGIGTVTWTNPGNASTSNNGYATASVDGTTTHYLKCTNYGFSIPADSTIDGIVVETEVKSNSTANGGSTDAAMRIVNAGNIGATDRATTTVYTTTDTYLAHGDATDLWGETWSVGAVNSSTFGAALASVKASAAGAAHTVSVDHIRITVYYTPPTTFLADGTNPGNVTIAPGASATSSDAFTFLTNSGTDNVTAVTVGLTPNTTSGLSKVEITSDNGATVYGSSTNPTADSFSITLNQNTLTATTATTTYRIRLTPKSHADMPAPPGAAYAVTSTITSFTSTNASSGTDGTSATITIDNLSTDEVTATSTVPGDSQITLNWTNPGGDFSNVIIIRATSSVSGTPAEGSSPSVNDPLGNGVVRYISNGTSTTDTGLTNGTTYHYKIFAKDTSGNYSASGVAASDTPVAAPPQAASAGNQTFTVGDGVTAISPITVTSTGASQITAANDIRITIATGTTNFRWDTTDTAATISGSASSSVSSTVSYEDASSTLVVNVTSDFSNGQSITISDLGYRDFGGVNAATSTRDVRWQGAGQAPPLVRDAKTVTIRGRLDLGAHSAGQEADKYAASSTASNQELFAFQLLPNDENASTTLVVDLSGISGIATGDITGAQIFVDANANGAIDGGETTTRFGAGTVSISGATGTIAFSTTSTVAAATSTRYIMKATTTALLAGDTIAFGLTSSSIGATGQTSLVALAPTAASPPSSATHTVDPSSRTQRSFRWQNDDGGVDSNTAVAAADTALTSVKIGERLTLRMQIDNDGGGEGSGLTYRLQFQANATSGAWTDVAAGSAIQTSQGLAGGDGASITTSTAAANARTFTAGTWHEGTAVSGGSITIANAGFTEFAYMIETSRAAASTTYYFRLANHAGPTALDAYPVFPSLTTVPDASHLTQYSKQAGSLPAATSSLTYFFDDLDYTRTTSDDGTYSTSTAAANMPAFLFRVRNTTSSHPLRVTWNGQYSAASTTFVEAYRFGSTNAWQTLTSTSTPSVNTDFTLAGVVATGTAEYYEADGSNFWAFFRVRQATTTGDLRTDYASIDFPPLLDSGTDQTFDVNQASTTSSQIRVKATRTPVATAASDIRIKIPAAFPMMWATSTTVVTLGGSASAKASTTVSYPDERTVLVNVTSDFAADDDLTVSGLKFTGFTSAAASTTLQAFYDGGSDSAADALDAKVKQIRGLYALADHTAGQEADKFDASGGSLTAAELLSFQITPTGENASTTQVVIDLYEVSGFAAANVTSTELRVDTNGDGAIGGGETTTVGGTGAVSISGGSGTITFSSPFAVTATTSIIFRANVTGIDAEDFMKMRVQPSGLTASGQTSKIALSPSGGTPSAVHAKKSARGGGGGPVDAPPAAPNVGGGGAGGGGTGGGGGGASTGGGGASGGGGAAP